MRAPIDRPSLLWRAFALVGIGGLKALSLSDTAWELWEDNVTDAVPRPAVRRLLTATLLLHATEAVVAYRWAGRGNVGHRGAWARTTLLYGFPELRLLRRQIRANRTAAVAAAGVDRAA
jgi:hypothetical protein